MVNRPTVSLFLDLPFSTAECDTGPIMEHCRGRATLAYDAEGDAGVVWTTLRFSNAIAAAFTPDPACAEWMLDAYSRVSEVGDSAWKRGLLTTAAARGTTLPASARHFVVYFDHVGCWEALADDVDLEPERM